MEIKEAVLALSALAQDSRLAVFRLLVQAGPEGVAAGAIAEDLGIPPATLSFHLSQLTQAGLSETRREGRSIIYALRVEGIRTLLGFLTKEFTVDHGRGPEPMIAVYVPTNHLYLGDILICRRDRASFPDISVEEGIRIFLTGGTAMPSRIAVLREGDRVKEFRV